MEYVKSAWKNIKMNKGRTILTMLGIIIGISSVITILSMGNGLKKDVTSSLDDITGGSVTIALDPKKTTKTITNDQIKAVGGAVPLISGATPHVNMYASCNVKRKAETRLTGGNEQSVVEFKDGFYSGRYYSEYDVESASEVCVLTQASAVVIFNTFDVLGMTLPVTLDDKIRELTVIGVLRSEEYDIENVRTLIANDQIGYIYADVFVPYTLFTSRYNLMDEKLSSFEIFPINGQSEAAAAKAIKVTENILGLRGQKAVTMQSLASMLDMYANIMDSVTLVIALVAAISLLVGGIGVMNIMTVTVTERTREIGIRKSLGARTSSIMLQFLIESSMICMIGGFIGMILGFLFSNVVGRLADLKAVILPSDVILVVAISVGVGVFFGIYPARKAAALNPIEALRME